MPFQYRNLETKRLEELSGDDIVYAHLAGRDPEITKDFLLISTLDAAQENMRCSHSFDRSKVYAPALCAFAILDQLGTCYSDGSRPVGTKGSGVQRALHQFCDIDDTSAISEHLYMFRNGLVHDASFASSSRDGTRHYMFRYSTLSEIVRLPEKQWDGTPEGLSNATTLVDPDRLIGLASSAIEGVQNIFFNDRGRLQVLKSREEILHKYILWLPRNQPPRRRPIGLTPL